MHTVSQNYIRILHVSMCDGWGRRLAGGSGKPSKDAEELGEATEDIGEGGSDGADIGGLFQGSGATSITVRGRDVGGHPKDGAGAEWVSTRGGKEAYRETGAEREERRVALPVPRGGHAVSRADGN